MDNRTKLNLRFLELANDTAAQHLNALALAIREDANGADQRFAAALEFAADCLTGEHKGDTFAQAWRVAVSPAARLQLRAFLLPEGRAVSRPGDAACGLPVVSDDGPATAPAGEPV